MANFIYPHHWQEWEESAIAPELIEANLRSFKAEPYGARDKILEFLYDLDEIKRDNTGRINGAFLRKHNYLNDGGWVSCGFNLYTGQRSDWGSLKPDHPKFDPKKGKNRKYEHPMGRKTEPHVPGIPLNIADFWLSNFDGWQEFKESYQGDPLFTAWAFVLEHPEVPLHLSEGNKKINSLTTHKGITFGFCGVWNWVVKGEVHTREDGSTYKVMTPFAHPLLCPNRELTIWFDEDPKKKSRWTVYSATLALTETLEEYGCKVNIACWSPEEGKGVDDAIALNGPDWLNTVNLYNLDQYKNRKVIEAQKKLNHLTYPYDVELNEQRLPDLLPLLPNSGIINLKSYKGSGKSYQLQKIVKKYKERGKKVISLTPRIALGRGQAVEWKIKWIDDLGRLKENVAVGLCWDSLKKIANIDWSEALVIIDEGELGLEHLLTSSTCKEVRPQILKILQDKIPECLNNGGTLILSDADLTDVPVDYFKSLAPLAPVFTIVNHAKPKPFNVSFATGKKDETLEEIFTAVSEGRKVAVTTDSQAEAEALAREMKNRFPDKRVDRVDSKTCQEDYGKNWVKNPNLSIEKNQPDLLIYTPSMGVGVSIDIDYFEEVYGLFHGVLAPSQCRQMLTRVRPTIPRIIWCAQKGMVKDDESSFFPDTIKWNIAWNTKDELDLLDVAKSVAPNAENAEDLYQALSAIRNDEEWDNCHLETYAKIKARKNYGLSQLAVQLRQELIEEGHNILDLSGDNSNEFGDALKEGKQLLKEEEASAIAEAEDIDLDEAKDILKQSSCTEEERHQAQKALIKEELPEAELTSDFVLKVIVEDKRKWLNATKLFWYLNNPEIAKYVDQRHWLYHLKQFSEGVPFIADIRSYSGKIKLLQDIGLLELLDPDNPEKTFTNNDEAVIALKDQCYQQRDRVRRLLGVKVSKNLTPMQLLSILAGKIGLSFTSTRQRINGQQIRIYKIDQEALVTPHRIEVLHALDRKGEQIIQNAHREENPTCATPPDIVNKLEEGVLVAAYQITDYFDLTEIPLEDRLVSLKKIIRDCGEGIVKALKFWASDPELITALANMS